MPYNIQLLPKGISIENTSDQTQKFLACNTKIETTQNHIRFYAGARKEQDVFFTLAEIQSLKDQNGNQLTKATLSEVFNGIVQNLCKCSNGATQNSMQIPTPKILLNNYPTSKNDKTTDQQNILVFWDDQENKDFLSYNPILLLLRYKRRSTSKKKNNNAGTTYYIFTKKGFVHPQHQQATTSQITEWSLPNQPNTSLQIDIQNVFITPYTRFNLFPKGQGAIQNTGGKRKPPMFQRFQFVIQIEKNGKKYFSEPSKIIKIGGNWKDKIKTVSERYKQIEFE